VRRGNASCWFVLDDGRLLSVDRAEPAAC
jgi:hypothetical protein